MDWTGAPALWQPFIRKIGAASFGPIALCVGAAAPLAMSALYRYCKKGGMVLTPEDERRLINFLEPSRIAVIATIGPSGAPQLTPNWYVCRGGKLMISTTKERVKYRNLVRDNRMTVCIYAEPEAEDYTTVWGRVTIRDDASIWPDTQAIVERYVPSEGVEARMQQLRTQNRVILELDPERVIFRT